MANVTMNASVNVGNLRAYVSFAHILLNLYDTLCNIALFC